ncbi:NAD-dependent epimerase/dehydratase family protein [soil metagenome]
MRQKENKKILLTGASGFLGGYIYNYFSEISDITSLGRKGINSEKHIFSDFKEEIPAFSSGYDLVIHAAGKAHVVPGNEVEKREFYEINLKGTENLLKSLSLSVHMPKSFIFISTVSVYGLESGENIEENAPLLAKDPYGLSKIKAEEEVLKWGKENEVVITILRLPLIIGYNAPGNLGSMIKAIKKGYYFNIGTGEAKRSMILAEDVPPIIEKLAPVGGIFNITDGSDLTYGEISSLIAQKMGIKKVKSLPDPVAKVLASTLSSMEKLTGKKMHFNKRVMEKMTSSLTFSNKKILETLEWRPRQVKENFDNIL